jgi:hypothetical protein
MLQCTTRCFLALEDKGIDMNHIIEPLLATLESQTHAIESLTFLGLSGAHRWAELNEYASLAVFDNSVHHLSILAISNDIDEVVELQIKSVLPALESAKAYASQVLALTEETSRGFGQFVESQLPNF